MTCSFMAKTDFILWIVFHKQLHPVYNLYSLQTAIYLSTSSSTQKPAASGHMKILDNISAFFLSQIFFYKIPALIYFRSEFLILFERCAAGYADVCRCLQIVVLIYERRCTHHSVPSATPLHTQTVYQTVYAVGGMNITSYGPYIFSADRQELNTF